MADERDKRTTRPRSRPDLDEVATRAAQAPRPPRLPSQEILRDQFPAWAETFKTQVLNEVRKEREGMERGLADHAARIIRAAVPAAVNAALPGSVEKALAPYAPALSEILVNSRDGKEWRDQLRKLEVHELATKMANEKLAERDAFLSRGVTTQQQTLTLQKTTVETQKLEAETSGVHTALAFAERDAKTRWRQPWLVLLGVVITVLGSGIVAVVISHAKH